VGKGPVGVRVLVVAKKRVTTVERRGTGEWCWTTWESHLTRGRVVPRGFALGCPGTTGLGIRRRTDSGPSRSCGMSGAASLRGWCDSSKTLSRVPEPVHQDHELESRMRENRLSGLGGGRRPKAVLYPHRCPFSAFLGSTPEKPAGVLGQERRKVGENSRLTVRPPFAKVAICLGMLRTNSPSPAQRLVRAGAQKAIS